jgi:hypothetical protein
LIFPENGYVTEENKRSISVLRLDLFITIPTSHKGKVWVSCACHEGIWGVEVYLLILNLWTRKILWYPFNSWRLLGPQSWPECPGEEKSLSPSPELMYDS